LLEVSSISGVYRFINTDVPTVGCNLRCEYCYIRQHGDEESMLEIDKRKELFRFSVEHMLVALSLKRMGGVCMFNISGSGETLLCPQILDIVCGLLETGHYVALITNCTIRSRIDEIVAFPQEYKKRLFFKVSFHYRELRRRKMLESFTENVHLLKRSGIAFSLEIVSGDHFLDDIDEIKSYSLANFGALPHVLTGRDEQIRGTYNRSSTRISEEEYDQVWSTFNSDLFLYQQRAYDIPHREFCYAGVYSGTLSLGTGDFSSCPGTHKITNFFENIGEPIQFVPVAHACPFDFCFCGFFLHVLAGVSRDYDPGVYFHHFRNRVCTDGSQWLTPSILEVFSHRCSEYHTPYSKDKAEFINVLMRMVYFDEELCEIDLEKIAITTGAFLRSRNIGKVAIYGMGKLGKWLIRVMQKVGIDVAYAIDKRAGDIECYFPVFFPDDELPNVDAIIVSVYSEYTAIAPMLWEKTSTPIISIVNLTDS